MSTISAQEDLFASLGLASQQTSNKGTNDASELGMETFLKLMVTQLNNQDPFKPMENGDFLGQIAQFGSVSGIDKLNRGLDDLSTSLTSGQTLQAGSLVGRQVLAPIDTGRLYTGGSVRGQVELANSSSDVVVRVTDQVGQLVREMSLGPADSGPLQFTWDGTDDSGNFAPSALYNFQVTAKTADGSNDLQTQLFAQVESVNLSEYGGLTLNLQGLGPIAFENVKQIH